MRKLHRTDTKANPRRVAPGEIAWCDLPGGGTARALVVRELGADRFELEALEDDDQGDDEGEGEGEGERRRRWSKGFRFVLPAAYVRPRQLDLWDECMQAGRLVALRDPPWIPEDDDAAEVTSETGRTPFLTGTAAPPTGCED